jgi:hypothetical protein
VEQTAKTADELRAAGIAPDEEIYAEKFLGTYYLVSKKNDDKVEKKKYVIGKNELMLCPDNRKDFQPSIVSRDLLLGRVEGKPPLVNESVRVLERMKK